MPARWSALTRSRNSSTALVGPAALAYAGWGAKNDTGW